MSLTVFLSCDLGKSRVPVDTLYALDVASYSAQSQGLSIPKAAINSVPTPSTRVTGQAAVGSGHPSIQRGQSANEVVAPPSSISKWSHDPSMVLPDVPSTGSASSSLDLPTRATEQLPVR